MLQINDDYRLQWDTSCVILEKRNFVDIKIDGVKTGEQKEVWTNLGYHANFKQALKWMVKNEIQVCDEYITIVKKIEELEKLISSLKLVK